MSYKSWFIFAPLFLLIFGVGWYLGSSHDADGAVAPIADVMADRNLESQQEKDHLKREVDRLRYLLEIAESAMEAREDKLERSDKLQEDVGVPVVDSTNDIGETRDYGPDVVKEVIDRYVAETNERLAADPNYDVRGEAASRYESRYEMEPINEEWAFQREQILQDLFAVREDLQGAVIKSLNCRSERCRIELYYQSEREVSDISDSLLRYFSREHQGLFAAGVMAQYLPDGEVVHLYLGEDVRTLFTH